MLTIVLLLFISLFKTDPPAPPPCSAKAVEASCGMGLAEGFMALKQVVLSPGQTQEISYVLGKDTDYLFTLCGQPTGGPPITINVLDAYRNLLFSNYDKRSKRHLPKVGFYSQSTGVVSIQLVPDKSMGACAMFTLGFRPL